MYGGLHITVFEANAGVTAGKTSALPKYHVGRLADLHPIRVGLDLVYLYMRDVNDLAANGHQLAKSDARMAGVRLAHIPAVKVIDIPRFTRSHQTI
jgi:hypothetical protein